jgi:hypothetical protein
MGCPVDFPYFNRPRVARIMRTTALILRALTEATVISRENTILTPDTAFESASATATDDPQNAATSFVLELARALHEYGTPAHHLEAAMQIVVRALGLNAEFFSTPTSIMVGFGGHIDQRVHLLRVEPGEPNLGKLAQLD